jgi:D-lactate dehydrogenase
MFFLCSFVQEHTGSGHQAFLTEEALRSIADTTIKNLKDMESTGTCANIVE